MINGGWLWQVEGGGIAGGFETGHKGKRKLRDVFLMGQLGEWQLTNIALGDANKEQAWRWRKQEFCFRPIKVEMYIRWPNDLSGLLWFL